MIPPRGRESYKDGGGRGDQPERGRPTVHGIVGGQRRQAKQYKADGKPRQRREGQRVGFATIAG
ncbi:MAG: hypothetical protein ABIY40_08950 [Rhodanobacteraceae bacterium]|nr:hypothetical protein [Pseudomonadota bacterium]